MSVFQLLWEFDSTKLWSEYNLTISVQTESVKVESVVLRGQRSQNRIGCDVMTQLLHIWIIIGGWYFTIYRNLVGRWFPVGNWCVVMGMELSGFEPSCSKINVVDLIYSPISGRKIPNLSF